MSLHYIIDGYNIIKHPKFNLSKKIKDKRIALLEFIRNKKRCGSSKNKITVVFDAYPGPLNLKQFGSKINVIFTKHMTADEKIKRMVEESANPKNIVVVSDDKEISFFVKSVGACSLCIEKFINPVRVDRDYKKKQKEDLIKAELTYSQIEKINQELRKIWLK